MNSNKHYILTYTHSCPPPPHAPAALPRKYKLGLIGRPGWNINAFAPVSTLTPIASWPRWAHGGGQPRARWVATGDSGLRDDRPPTRALSTRASRTRRTMMETGMTRAYLVIEPYSCSSLGCTTHHHLYHIPISTEGLSRGELRRPPGGGWAPPSAAPGGAAASPKPDPDSTSVACEI